MARDLKFRNKEVKGLFYLCCKSKGTGRLRGYRAADRRLCFHICQNRFSHGAAQTKDVVKCWYVQLIPSLDYYVEKRFVKIVAPFLFL